MLQFARIPFVALLITVLSGSIAWFVNLPLDVGPDVPAGKLRSLSFAPYRDGYSPINQKFPLPEHIDGDVALLADKTYSIRTYSSRGGMQPTPDFARKHGVDMILGGWLGDGHPENQIEIDTLIKTANAHPDVVKRVIVGNEVLLRKDMDVDTLIGYIRQVKQAVKQPVTYADVWSSYLQNPQLFNEVDFITIHILPYWEDEPVAIERAAEHIEKIVQQIKSKAREMGQDKPILIGESGWPAMGRQRGQAVPSVINEARFIRELIQVANRHDLDYNIVEAFNQPWKSHNEGVVGANWGLLSVDREPVFPLTGPVQENPNWKLHFAWSAALLWLSVAIYWRKLNSLTPIRLAVFLASAQIFAISLVYLAVFLWYTSYSDWQRVYTILILAANGGLAVWLLQRCHDLLASHNDDAALAERLRLAYTAFAALALFKTYSLAFDGRYLSFPSEQFSVPVIGLLVLLLCRRFGRRAPGYGYWSFESLSGGHSKPRDHFFAYGLNVGAAATVLGEVYGFLVSYDFTQAYPNLNEGLPVAASYTLQNQQLVVWLFCILILAIPFSSRHWRSRVVVQSPTQNMEK